MNKNKNQCVPARWSPVWLIMPITEPLRYISNAFLNIWAEYCPFKWNEIVPLAGHALYSFHLLFPTAVKPPQH